MQKALYKQDSSPRYVTVRCIFYSGPTDTFKTKNIRFGRLPFPLQPSFSVCRGVLLRSAPLSKNIQLCTSFLNLYIKGTTFSAFVNRGETNGYKYKKIAYNST